MLGPEERAPHRGWVRIFAKSSPGGARGWGSRRRGRGWQQNALSGKRGTKEGGRVREEEGRRGEEVEMGAGTDGARRSERGEREGRS